VILVHALGASENVENSTVPGRTPQLLTASLSAIRRRAAVAYASPELYLGTRVSVGGEPCLGIVRGVTPAAALVRRSAQIVEGRWPGPGEVLVGRLAATKLGRSEGDLAVGRDVTFEGRTWRVCGKFAAAGSALESELWCPLEDLQPALKRQDLSLVAVTLAAGADAADIDEFCKERLDLELQSTPEAAYYEALRRHYRPVRVLAWLVVALVAGAGVFAGLNAMYGAVVGRVRELATLDSLVSAERSAAVASVSVRRAEAELAAAEAAAGELALRRRRLEREAASLPRMRADFRSGREPATEEPPTEAEASMRSALARLRQSQVAADTARLRLERLTVRAPADGRVLGLVARPGTKLMGQDPRAPADASTVVTLFDPRSLQVRVDVRLEDVPRARPARRCGSRRRRPPAARSRARCWRSPARPTSRRTPSRSRCP
jgi:hypothetical protein